MEDKNVLSESEETAVTGGNIVSAGGSAYTCPNCGSEMVVITTQRPERPAAPQRCLQKVQTHMGVMMVNNPRLKSQACKSLD